MNDERPLLALLLERIDGLGRVGIRRLLSSFGSIDDILKCPLEQIIVRLKGIGKASAIAAQLHDRSLIDRLTKDAVSQLKALRDRQVALLAKDMHNWPVLVDELGSRFAPASLYCFGDAEILGTRSVAVIVSSESPLPDEEFSQLQRILVGLIDRDVVPIVGAESGTDVVVAKLAIDRPDPGRVVCVAATGLAKIAKPIRPIVSQVARTGGCVVSPFSMTHGPFSHDHVEQIHIQAALGTIVIIAGRIPESANDQTGHPLNQVISWCHDRHKPLFAIGSRLQRSDVHPLIVEEDDEWVHAAIDSTKK